MLAEATRDPPMQPSKEYIVRMYYEDTDHSGFVYHANYLKYFERAREHFLGLDLMMQLQNEYGIGFAVYHADITYKQGAVFGDELRIETEAKLLSPYRMQLFQNAIHHSRGSLMVESVIDLVCIDSERKLVKVPELLLGLF